MATAVRTLEMRIRALIEGLSDLRDFTVEATGATTAATKLKTAVSDSGGTEATNSFSQAISNMTANLRRFGQSDAPAFSQASKDVAAGIKTVKDGALVATKPLADVVEGVGGLGGAAGAVAAPLGLLEGQIGKLIKVFLAFAGIAGLKAMADGAARTETLGVTLGVVARNAGYTKEQIDGYEKSLIKLGITAASARESLTSLIQAGIELSTVNERGMTTAAALARAAQDLAVVTGQNSSETLQRLVLNIQQMDSMGLRYMGLLVNIEDAQNKFALSLGKTAAALTSQQKQQAVLNEVLVKATALQGAYEESMDTVGKKVASLSRYQKELGDAIGGKVLPAYSAAVDVITSFLQKATTMAAEVDKNGALAESFGSAIRTAFNGISNLLLGVGKFLADIAPPFVALANVVLQLVGTLTSALGVILNFGAASDKAGEGAGLLATIIKTLTVIVGGSLAILVDLVRIVGGSLFVAFGTLGKGIGTVIQGLGYFIGLANKEAGKAVSDFGKEMVATGEYMTGFGKETIKADSQLGKFKDTINGVNTSLHGFGKGTNFKELQDEITGLIEAQRKNTITNDEAAAAYKVIETRIKDMGKAGAITTTELNTLNGQLGQVPQKIADSYNKALTDLKLNMTELRTGVSSDAQQIAANLETLALGIGAITNTTSSDLAKAFQVKSESIKSFQDLNSVIQTLGKTTVAAKLNSDDYSETLQQLLVQSTALVDADIKKAQSTSDLAKITTTLFDQQKLVFDQFATGKINATEYEDAMRLIGTSIEATKDATTRLKLELANVGLSAPLKELGTSLEKIKLGITDAEQGIVRAFGNIADSGKLTSSELDRAFQSALGKIDSLPALSNLIDRLRQAAAEGKITGKDLEDANAKAAIKFEELFQAQLKSANTQQDFARLRVEIEKMGANGELSAGQVSRALVELGKAANRAQSDVVALAEQLTAAQRQATNVGQASVAVAQAQADAYRASSRVLVAQAAYQKDMNVVTAAAYQLALAEQALTQDKLKLSRLKYNEEVAQYDVLINKQRQLNLEKQLEGDAGNQSLQARLQILKDEGVQNSLNLETTRQSVETQQQHTLETEKLVIQSQLSLDLAKDQQTILDSNKQQVQGTATAMAQVADNTTRAGGEMRNFGAAAGAAQGAAAALAQSMATVGSVAAEAGMQVANLSEGAKSALSNIASLRNTRQAEANLADDTNPDNIQGSRPGTFVPGQGLVAIDNDPKKDPFAPQNMFAELNKKNATTSKAGAAVDNTGLESLIKKRKLVDGKDAEWTDQDLQVALKVRETEQFNRMIAGKYATSFTQEGIRDAMGRASQSETLVDQIKRSLAQQKRAAAKPANDPTAGSAAPSSPDIPQPAPTPSVADQLPSQSLPASVQSIAPDVLTQAGRDAANSAGKSSAEIVPIRKVQLDLMTSSGPLTAFVNDGDDQKFLDAIAQVARRS